jgi:hypothetical protein
MAMFPFVPAIDYDSAEASPRQHDGIFLGELYGGEEPEGCGTELVRLPVFCKKCSFYQPLTSRRRWAIFSKISPFWPDLTRRSRIGVLTWRPAPPLKELSGDHQGMRISLADELSQMWVGVIGICLALNCPPVRPWLSGSHKTGLEDRPLRQDRPSPAEP